MVWSHQLRTTWGYQNMLRRCSVLLRHGMFFWYKTHRIHVWLIFLFIEPGRVLFMSVGTHMRSLFFCIEHIRGLRFFRICWDRKHTPLCLCWAYRTQKNTLEHILNTLLVGGLEHDFYFPIYWNWSSQLTHIFQRGRYTTHQIMCVSVFHC